MRLLRTMPSHPTRVIAAMCILALIMTTRAVADDWPNWRGPNHTGISDEKGWNEKAADNPKILWRANVGKGWSSFAVVKDRAYTMGNVDNNDVVTCLDTTSGKEVWKKSYQCPAGDYPGPRSTPCVSDGRVFTLSRNGDLNCFNADTGKVEWSQKLNVKPPTWGLASSPIVIDKTLYLNVGDCGIALTAASGKGEWATGDGPAGYASPVPVGSGRKGTLLMFASKGLAAVGADKGGRAWFFPWETQYDVNAADPVVAGANVFISSGYNKGCAMLAVGGGRPRVVWQNRNMRNHYSSCVYLDGAIYGFDEGTVRCLDAKTGEPTWSQGGLGKGGLIMADKKLVVLSEGGELVIAEASKEAFKPLSRGRVVRGRCWTPPALANGKIFGRTSDGDIACVDASK